MGKLTKDIFVSTIEAIRGQVDYDIDQHFALSSALKLDDGVLPIYDNSLLVKALFVLLHATFPKDEKGFCDIEHYCFDLNFGNVSEDKFISIEELWCALTGDVEEVAFYAHPLIDDMPSYYKS
jgi:hypothetical protein